MTAVKQLYEAFLDSTGVTTDSRRVARGNIFFALAGENYDGHKFIAQALKEGCRLAVIDKSEFAIPGRTILTDNVLTSLQQLARHHRRQFEIPVVAVTGSNGKTTTKELMREVLSKKYDTLATAGNLNNHIGVPLTLLGLNEHHRMAIIEMGANHCGEIDLLCRIACPTHGLITNAGHAHLEGFGSPGAVLRAKSELFAYLAATGGQIFLNHDRPNLRKVLKGLDAEYVSYGSKEGNFVSGARLDGNDRLELEVRIKESGESYILKTLLAGAYNFENVLAAVCTGVWFGVNPLEIRAALEGYNPGNNRSQIMETQRNRLLLDAYNANPDSMREAINNFFGMPGENKSVILGDMLELGKYAGEEHRKIIRLLIERNCPMALLVGEIFCKIPVPDNFLCFENTGKLTEWLEQTPVHGRFILLKGSRGIRLEECIPAL